MSKQRLVTCDMTNVHFSQASIDLMSFKLQCFLLHSHFLILWKQEEIPGLRWDFVWLYVARCNMTGLLISILCAFLHFSVLFLIIGYPSRTKVNLNAVLVRNLGCIVSLASLRWCLCQLCSIMRMFFKCFWHAFVICLHYKISWFHLNQTNKEEVRYIMRK